MTTTINPNRRSSEAFGTEPGDPARAATLGGPGERLSADQVTEFVTRTLGAADLDGKRVCLVVPDGTPCYTYVGSDGAGHFVKMVHNGIEYADMQLIAEAYDLIRQGTGKSAAEIGDLHILELR